LGRQPISFLEVFGNPVLNRSFIPFPVLFPGWGSIIPIYPSGAFVSLEGGVYVDFLPLPNLSEIVDTMRYHPNLQVSRYPLLVSVQEIVNTLESHLGLVPRQRGRVILHVLPAPLHDFQAIGAVFVQFYGIVYNIVSGNYDQGIRGFYNGMLGARGHSNVLSLTRGISSQILADAGRIVPLLHPLYLGYELTPSAAYNILSAQIHGRFHNWNLLVTILDALCCNHRDLGSVYILREENPTPPFTFCTRLHRLVFGLDGVFRVTHLTVISGGPQGRTLVSDWGAHICLQDPLVQAAYVKSNYKTLLRTRDVVPLYFFR
jgi:hypothetical protein